MKEVIRLDNIRRDFVVGDEVVHALRGISLTITEGEFVTIMGTSGSGKSTLLRCAAMLETMDGGDLTYLGEQAVTMQNGKSVYAKPAVLRKIQENFGMVFQSFHLFPHYDVMKNLCDAPIHVQKRNDRQKSCCRKWGSQEKKRRIRVSFPAVSVRGLRLRVR